MTEMVKRQRAKGLSPAFIKCTAMLAAAGFTGLGIDNLSRRIGPRRADYNKYIKARVVRRFGGPYSFMRKVNELFQGKL